MILQINSKLKINNFVEFKSLFLFSEYEKYKYFFYNLNNTYYLFYGAAYYLKTSKDKIKLLKKKNFSHLNKILNLDKKIVRNNLEGVYLIFKYSPSKGFEVFSDKNARKDLYYTDTNKNILLSDNLSQILQTNKNSFKDLNQMSIFNVLNVYAAYIPKKETIYKKINRLGYNEFLTIKNSKLTVKKFNITLNKILENKSNQSVEDLYSQKINNSFISRTSSNMNWVLMSSGWDTSYILSTLVKLCAKKNITCVIGKVTYSKKFGPCNMNEINKAKKIANYFNVKLKIINIDWTKESFLKQSNKFDEISRTHSIYTLISYNFHILYEYIFSKVSKNDVIFNGDYSDGVHNFGFSQTAGILEINNKEFRQYFDKMCCYLYSPNFYKEFTKNKHLDDKIYKLILDLKKFKVSKQNFRKFEYFASLFLSEKRIPFTELVYEKFFTKIGSKKYLKHINDRYFKDILQKTNIKNIYSAILQLYNSFHWQGGTVRLLTMLPEYKGYNASTPFSDSNFINLMETLDSKFGRSLELKPTKHLLKNNLINKLEFNEDLQVGPHSYIYDTNMSWNVNHEILYNSILRKKFIKILKKTKFLEKLDKRIFNIKKIKKIIDLYLKNKDIGSENYIFLLNLLGLIKINNF